MLVDIEAQTIFAGKSYSQQILALAPSARSFFSVTAGSSEWLNRSLRWMSYVPRNLFEFESARESGALRVFGQIKDAEFARSFRPPCILLTSHTSLTFGEAPVFLQQMTYSPERNYVI
jgi:hypothetical protein